MTSRATTLQRPNPLPKQRLSSMFWNLARGSGVETDSRDPEAVVRHLLAVIQSLEGARRGQEISADSLSFLLQLEHDPYYASPEQTRGGEKDSQSLVYSIGILLFERLTGHHPFVESLSPIHCAVIRDRSQRIGANNIASIPSSLRAVISRSLAPFSHDRWDGVAELRRELEGFLGRAETILAPLPNRRAGSRPPLSRAPTKLHEPELPTLSRRHQSTADGTPRRRQFADGTGPHGRRRARRVTPPPPPGSAEREDSQSRSYADIVVKQRADSAGEGQQTRAESPPLSDSINRLVPFEPPSLRSRTQPSSRFVVGALSVVLITILATVALIVISQTRAVAMPVNTAAEIELPAPPPPKATVIATPVVNETEPTAKPLVKAAPKPSIFDVRYGGANAVDAARTCFGEARLARSVKVGATVLFSSRTGNSSQVYLASNMRVNATERACLQQKLKGVSAGAPPRRGTLVTYTLFLTADGGRAHAQRRK